MNNKILIIFICLVLGIGLGILITQNNHSFTGYAVDDSGVIQDNSFSDNESFTREDAIQALNESQEILNKMKAANFSGIFVGDLLIEAEKVFQQVEYVDILRNNSLSTREKSEARGALDLVDWRFINYSDVLEYTDEIKEVRDLAFLVQDLLSIQESFLGAEKDDSGEIVSFTLVEDVDLERFRFLINEVQLAIDESRYDEAFILAEELKEEVDIRRTEVFTSLVLARTFKNFILKYWYFAILTLAVLVLVGIYFSKNIKKYFLKKKIHKMKVESKVIIKLIKKVQTERFKQNKIPELVYNIRMKSYKSKLEKIKQELPVLEKKLVIRGRKIPKHK
jgi:hypothetical protein